MMSILQVSISASILILVVIVIRSITLYKLSKRVFVFFWGVIVFRLLLPIRIPSHFSIYTLLEHILQSEQAEVPLSIKSTNTFGVARNLLEQQSTSHNTIFSSISLAHIIWLLGVFCLGMYFIMAYIGWKRRFNQSIPIDSEFISNWLNSYACQKKPRIYLNEYVKTPLTYGVFHPTILLPIDLNIKDEEALHYILAHESTHIHHRDAIKKIVLAIVVSIYWFNPFVWIMYFLATQDIELYCDEIVVKKFSSSSSTCNQSAYALTLLRLETKKCSSYLLSNYFNKNSLQERIEAIMKIKKLSTFTAIIAVAFVLSMTVVFATSASHASADNTPKQISPTMMASYYDKESGNTLYTFDNGKSYVALSETEKAELFNTPDIEWWTYDEYKQWMEDEKRNMEDMIGEKCSDSRGEYVWSQEDVDAQMKIYEQNLDDLKNGKMLSKTVNGNPDLQIGYDPEVTMSSIPQ